MLRRVAAWSVGAAIVLASAQGVAAPAVDEVDEIETVGSDEIDEVEAVAPPPKVDEVDEVDAVETLSPAEPVEPEPAVTETAVAPVSPDPETPTVVAEEVTAEAAPTPRPWQPEARMFGLVQVDFLMLQRSEDQLGDGSAEPLNEDGFLLRNARIGGEADWRYFGVRGVAEFFSRGGPVRPLTVDVHAQLPGKDGDPPLLKVSAGLLRVPFGFELYGQTDGQRFFGERTLVSEALIPGVFDAGASVSGHVWALDWIVGIYNGQPVGAPGYGFRDPNRAKDYAGRLHLRGDLVSRLNAALGFSFMRGKGFSAGTPPTKDDFEWVDLNEDGRVTLAELIPIPGSAGRPSENFERWAVGADAQVRVDVPTLGELLLYGEFAFLDNYDRGVAFADPVLLGRDQRGIGWYAGFVQALTRHAGIGARYDAYYPQLDRLEPYDGTVVVTRRRFRTLTSAVSGYLRHSDRIRARLLVEYDWQIDNDLGRDANGRPAKLDNDTFRVRAEVAF